MKKNIPNINNRKTDRKSRHIRQQNTTPTENKNATIRKVPEIIRLNRFLAMSGICSRRDADNLIAAGKVTVNGKKVSELGVKVKITDDVRVKGEKIYPEKKIYIVLNKPKDYITTLNDPQGRKTIMDLIDLPGKERIFPVGRLDRATTGILLLTNDGELSAKLTHPRFMQKKIYHVFLDKPVIRKDLQKLVDGIVVDHETVKADKVAYVDEDDKTQVGIEIHSGKYRIIRRMFAHLGYDVVRLDRVSFAGLTKKNLPRGKWRHLTSREVSMLYRSIPKGKKQ